MEKLDLLDGATGDELANVNFIGAGGGAPNVDDFSLAQEARTSLLALRYDALWGDRRISTTLSHHAFEESFGMLGRLVSGTRVSRAGDQTRPLRFERGVAVADLTLKQTLASSPRLGHFAEAGLELHALDTSWSYRIGDSRSNSLPTAPTVTFENQGFPGSSLPGSLDSDVNALRWGIFFRDAFDVNGRLRLDLGARLDRSGVNRSTSFSPRARAEYSLDARSRLSGSVGLYYQSPGYEKLFVANTFVDLSVPSERQGLSNERSLAVELGYTRELVAGVELRLEGYYRDFDDVLLGRLETEAERTSRLSLYDFPPELADEIPGARLVTLRYAAHLVMVEAAERFNKLVIEFLDES